MTLLSYINLTKEQRINNKEYPKEHYFDSIRPFNKLATKVWTDIQAYNNTKFINVIEFEQPLYLDTDDLFYYELIDTSPRDRSILSQWKYFYLPISYKQQLIDNNYLPFLHSYDVNTNTYEKIYPEKPYLFRKERVNTFFSTILRNDYIHPFSYNFIFTGVMFVTSSSKVLYEYIDYRQLTDFNEVTYYSEIKPLNFILEDDIFQSSEFYTEVVLNRDQAPSKLIWSGDEFINYTFDGLTTTRKFANFGFQYVYLRRLDGIRELLPDAPTNLSLLSIKSQFEGTEMGIQLPFNFTNTQRLIRKQQSDNNIIKIGDS